MNYFATVETITRRSGGRRDTRPRANMHNGSGLLWRSPAVRKSDAAIEHAGIARSVRFMQRHFHTPIRVTDLTVVAGLSRRGFLKSFRKHTGRAPGEVLRRIRIEHAKRLLAERDLPSAVVAFASGFRKTNSFLVAFKSVTGCSPAQYKLQVRAEINMHGVRVETNGAGQRCAPTRRASSRLNLNL